MWFRQFVAVVSHPDHTGKLAVIVRILAEAHTHEPKTNLPRKRGPVDSDDEYFVGPVATSQLVVASRSRHQKRASVRTGDFIELHTDEEEQLRCPQVSRRDTTHAARTPLIEILDSSEEDLAEPASSATLPTHASPSKRSTRPSKHSQKLIAKNTKGVRAEDLPLVPEVNPPSEFAAAFQVLWSARRTVSRLP